MVDGGGFINTSRGILTTGNPLIDANGNLTGFHVTQGNIVVQGDGFNASNIDQADLIARAVQVNAAIYANTLNVVTGANNVDYATLNATPVAGTGTAPSVSIDVAQLGGMYANSITLVGTENGVGVANAGTIAAQAGDLVLTSSGQLVQASSGQMKASSNINANAAAGISNAGSMVAQQAVSLASGGGTLANSGTFTAQGGDLTLTTGGQVRQDGQARASGNVTLNGAAGVENSGATYAQQTTTVTTGGNFQNSGTLASQQDTAVNAGSVASSGTLAAGINPDGTTGSSGNLTVTSAGGLSANGYNIAPGRVTLYGVTLDLSNAQTSVGTALALTATGGNLNLSGATTSAGTSITASATGEFVNDGGKFSAPQLVISTENLSNRSGDITQTGTGPISVAVTGTFDNTGGSLQTNSADLSLTPAALLNDNGKIADAGTGTLSINTSSLSNNGGEVATNGALGIQADTVSNQGGQIAAQSSATLTVGSLDNSAGGYIGANAVGITGTGAINNASGIIESNTALDVSGQTVNNDGGRVHALGSSSASVSASGALTNCGGDISSNADLAIHGGSVDNSGGTFAAAKNLTLTSDTTLTNDNAAAEAGGNVDVTAGGALSNRNGHIGALGPASQTNVSAQSIDDTSGSITNAGTGPLNVTAAESIVNAGAGLIAGNGDVTLNTGDLINEGSTVSAAGALALNVATALDNNQGVLASSGALALNGANASASNVGGSISGADISTKTASLDNSSGQIANSPGGTGNITIQSGALANGGGVIGSAADLILDAATLTGIGQIIGGRDATVSLGGDYTYDAASLITANRNLSFTIPGTLTNNGMLGAAGNATITAANLINSAGAMISSGNPGDPSTGTTAVNVTNDISNAGGIEGNTVTTNSATLENAGSMIGDTVTVNAGTLTNDGAAAIIAGVRQVNLWVPGTFTNSNGAMVYSLGDVNIAANGTTDANGNLVSQTGTVSNLSSTIQAQNALNIAANVLNNVRENVQTETTSTSQTYVMHELPWWNTNGVGGFGPFNDANTIITDAYYVNPADIVSVTPVVTPDGYVIQKVVVNLSADVSAFEWKQSGQSYQLANNRQQIQWGQQLRLTPDAGQVTLYVTNYATGQSNPDQVTGTVGAWPVLPLTTILNPMGSITYSSEFGNCTTDCVRLETYPDYTDPTTQIIKQTEKRTATSTPLEIERDATETITSTTLADASGAPAILTSGGAMNLTIGPLLNNDNGTIAAGGNLNLNGLAQADGGSSAVIRNTATQLTTTWSFDNRSGYASVNSNVETTVPTAWTEWTNPSITLNTGTAGGTITSNQAVTITGGSISNTSVVAGNVPTGASAQALGLSSVNVTGSGPGAIRTASGARATTPNLTLPQSGLYSLHPAPGAQYLVETDPRFTNYAKFISSDYMLNQLGYNPQSIEKRLGDGLYEEQLVQNQITQLTGKVYLQGYDDNLAEYTALMNSGVTVAQQFGLEVGVALTDAQMAALTSDIVWLVNETVTLPDGSTQTVLVPQVYLASSDSATLEANGALIAGDSVALGADDITNSSSTIQGNRNVVMVANGNITNLGGQISGGTVALAAGNDIINQSTTSAQVAQFTTGSSTHTVVSGLGQITATGGDLTMQAGHDVTIEGAQTSGSGNLGMAAGHAINIGTVQTSDTVAMSTNSKNTGEWSDTRNAGSAISAGGSLGLASGGDITVTGSSVASGGSMALVGAGNVTIQGATDTAAIDLNGNDGKHREMDNRMGQSNAGSTLSAGDGLTVVAGQSATPGTLSVSGSSIVAGTNGQGNGAIQLGASGDINIGATYTQTSGDHTSHSESGGFLSHSTTDTARQYAGTQANGSLISGDTVTVAAGHDLNIQGSTVVGTNDVNLAAAGNVNITISQDTATQDSYYHQTHSGIGTSGLSVTIGTQSGLETGHSSTVTNDASVVGSISGNLAVSAGKDLHVTGSELVAGGNVTGTAQNVIIDSATDTYSQTQNQQSRSSGLSIGLSGSVGDAINGVYQQGQALASGNSDGRATALRAIAAAGDAGLAGYGAKQLADGATGAQAPSIGIQVSIGSSHSSSDFSESQTTQKGSTVMAGGTVAFAATGDGTPGSGNLTVAGSDISGTNVLLAAKNQVNLLNTTNTDSTRSSNGSSGWSVGVSVGTNGVGISASMQNAHGDGNSDAAMQNSTHVTGTNSVAIVSGGDTNIVGSAVTGGTVAANIGGNLNVVSVQDTTASAAHQSSAGGGFSASTAGGSASFSAQNGHADGTYAQVNEQAAIRAGDGGFDISVKGNTDLKGAVISSTADASQNSLTTGTLTFSDIENQSHYSANSAGVTVGGGIDSTGKAMGPGSTPGGVLPTFASESGDQSATTRSAIGAGTITITDEANQRQDLANLSRDTSNTNGTVSQTPDVQALLNEQADLMEAMRAAGQVVAQAIGTYASMKKEEADKAAIAAWEAGDMNAYNAAVAESKLWDEGGSNRIALHVAGGALLGGLGGGSFGTALQGAAGAGLSAAMARELNSLSKGIEESTGSALLDNLASNVLAGAGGALVGGGTGAFTAANADLYNRQLHPNERKLAKYIAEKSNGQYTQAQAEDQMRIMGMCTNDGCVSANVAEELNGRAPNDPGAQWINTGLTNANGNPLIVQSLPAANQALQSFIMENYNAATPGQVPSAFVYQLTPVPTDIRGMVADAAGVVSTNAGRISATASAALAVPGPHQPGALTTAGGAAMVSLAAEAVAQALKPDPVGMFKDDFVIGIPANLLADRFPMLSPVINEFAEKIKAETKK